MIYAWTMVEPTRHAVAGLVPGALPAFGTILAAVLVAAWVVYLGQGNGRDR